MKLNALRLLLLDCSSRFCCETLEKALVQEIAFEVTSSHSNDIGMWLN